MNAMGLILVFNDFSQKFQNKMFGRKLIHENSRKFLDVSP